MYDIAVRKLALRMVADLGVLKTSVLTNISRSTLETLWCKSKTT